MAPNPYTLFDPLWRPLMNNRCLEVFSSHNNNNHNNLLGANTTSISSRSHQPDSDSHPASGRFRSAYKYSLLTGAMGFGSLALPY